MYVHLCVWLPCSNLAPLCTVECCPALGLSSSFFTCLLAFSKLIVHAFTWGEESQKRSGKTILDSSLAFNTFILDQLPNATCPCPFPPWTARLPDSVSFLLPLVCPEHHCWAYLPETPVSHQSPPEKSPYLEITYSLLLSLIYKYLPSAHFGLYSHTQLISTIFIIRQAWVQIPSWPFADYETLGKFLILS